jgi:hypothetical protein
MADGKVSRNGKRVARKTAAAGSAKMWEPVCESKIRMFSGWLKAAL